MMYSPGEFQFAQGEQVTVYKVQDLQLALEKAMQNISELQNNLSFMIKYNEQLKQDHLTQQKRLNKSIEQLQNILTKKDKEILILKQKHVEYENLLSDTKQALNQYKQSIQEKQELLERYERIIHQQKTTISSLQDQLLNNKYNEVSINQSVNQSCFIQLQQLQRQIQQFEYQNKRLTNNLQKQTRKVNLLQKQNTEFKSWLGEITGVRKVVSGCQKVLMNEISRKLMNNRSDLM